MNLTYPIGSVTPVFDEENLIACAGLVPVMDLAEQAGLSRLLGERVDLGATMVASAGVNPAGKATAIVAGMAAGADSIDDLQLIRSGGTGRVFGQVFAPATLGQFLREFTYGHVSQLDAVARDHLVGLAERTGLLSGPDNDRVFIDIDSMLRPVFGAKKQGASFGHTKISGKQVLRKGLSALMTTICTRRRAPVVAGMRLRAGKAGSARGAPSMIAAAARTTGRIRPDATIMLRGDSAFGNHKVVRTCLREGIEFSVTMVQNASVARAISDIPGDAWAPVHYPEAVLDPDTGTLISDAEVAEITYAAFTSKKEKYHVTARLVVRRVKDKAKQQDGMFTVWRYHPFLTNSSLSTVAADLTHRHHAIIETTNADLIDGPLAHLPSGYFAANAAWAVLAQITHNLTRAAASLTRSRLANARAHTIRDQIINVPARLARPQRRPVLHLIQDWPWENRWLDIWNAVTGHAHTPMPGAVGHGHAPPAAA